MILHYFTFLWNFLLVLLVLNWHLLKYYLIFLKAGIIVATCVVGTIMIFSSLLIPFIHYILMQIVWFISQRGPSLTIECHNSECTHNQQCSTSASVCAMPLSLLPYGDFLKLISKGGNLIKTPEPSRCHVNVMITVITTTQGYTLSINQMSGNRLVKKELLSWSLNNFLFLFPT